MSEQDIQTILNAIGKLETEIKHLATKEEVAGIKSKIEHLATKEEVANVKVWVGFVLGAILISLVVPLIESLISRI